ncbi:MAG TPA: L,D-transpeptidase [Candidatus Aenigmarchaeota archaeon]|nr:L,D-transpeptidase [Candidatus Aenigmarchaeota archaeon]
MTEFRGDYIEICLSKRELYLYTKGFCKKYPVAVGSEKYPTPTGLFTIKSIKEKPSMMLPLDADWVSEEKKEWIRKNGPIPYGDPRNGLGPYWFGFGNGYGIHGTKNPSCIGRAVSHGCIRMRNEDLTELAGYVYEGMSVVIKE